MTKTDVNRRGILSLSAGALCAGASAFAAPGSRRMDFADPATRLKAFMMMRGALDDRLVTGCLSGRYYGVVDEDVMPFFGVVSATFARFRPASDGGFEGASYEVPFFTDLETGNALDRLANPYTGEDVSVPQLVFPAARISVARDLIITVPGAPAGMEFKHHVLPAFQSGENVWMVEETFSSIQIPNRPKPMHYTEILTLRARASDLLLPHVRRVPCETNYESISSWRPWLKMGDHPGHLNGTGVGRYGLPIGEMPSNWLEAVSARRPDVLKEPGAPLDALLKG